MDIDKRISLIKEVGEEIITLNDLRELLETKKKPIAYDGFEPSGNMHIAQGILRTINVNKMVKAGIHFKVLVADWFAWMNNKMDGDLDKIRVTGDYFIEMWKACGMRTDEIDFIWSKDLIQEEGHWKATVDIARHSSVERILRTAQIMGRKSTDKLSAAQIIYPCMQAADIFHLGADITQLGMDQRKVNVLAREVGPKIGFYKPVVVSHHMIMGLGQPPGKTTSAEDRAIELKMSKSNPNSAIFMTDEEKVIQKKINKAYCPEKVVEENPVLEYARYILFEKFKTLKVERPEKFGGDLELTSYDETVKLFKKGDLHPMDLKATVATHTNKLIEPVRNHFKTNGKAKKLLEQVESFKVTR